MCMCMTMVLVPALQVVFVWKPSLVFTKIPNPLDKI